MEALTEHGPNGSPHRTMDLIEALTELTLFGSGLVIDTCHKRFGMQYSFIECFY